MAIQVSGVDVIDNDRNVNVGIITANSIDVTPATLSFSPADGSSSISNDTNIVITFDNDMSKGSGNITLRDGSASGDVLDTIAVSSGEVSISGGVVTINPSSNLPSGKDIYVVVPGGAFTTTSLGSNSAEINTYNFSTGPVIPSGSYSPNNGASNQAIETNIYMYWSDQISTTGATGTITLRSGSSSGTVIPASITVASNYIYVNPTSDLPYSTTIYLVVEADAVRNSDGDAASGNSATNYYFSTEAAPPPLGVFWFDQGAYIVCCANSIHYLVNPVNTSTDWFGRNVAVTVAQQRTRCYGWFFPNCTQMQNPGIQCMQYWHPIRSVYWTTSTAGTMAIYASFGTNYGTLGTYQKTDIFYGAAFRNISY